jgi:hypothetical protein
MISKLVGLLMHSRNQTHIFHLQTSSYAKHKALQGYYEGIIPLVDSLVESYQGREGILQNIEVPPSIPNMIAGDNPQVYLKEVLNFVESNRSKMPQYSDLQNIYDEIIALLTKTIYLLTQLS